MKKNRRKRICILILAILFFVNGWPNFLKGIFMPKPNQNEIIFIDQYLNNASGYQNHGVFMDRNGYIYEFDFDEVSKNYPGKDKLATEEMFL